MKITKYEIFCDKCKNSIGHLFHDLNISIEAIGLENFNSSSFAAEFIQIKLFRPDHPRDREVILCKDCFIKFIIGPVAEDSDILEERSDL